MIGDILDVATNADIIVKSGAWFAYKGEKIGQGRENAKQYLEDNPAVLAEVEKAVRDYYALEGDKDAAKATKDGEEAPAKKSSKA